MATEPPDQLDGVPKKGLRNNSNKAGAVEVSAATGVNAKRQRGLGQASAKVVAANTNTSAREVVPNTAESACVAGAETQIGAVPRRAGHILGDRKSKTKSSRARTTQGTETDDDHQANAGYTTVETFLGPENGPALEAENENTPENTDVGSSAQAPTDPTISLPATGSHSRGDTELAIAEPVGNSLAFVTQADEVDPEDLQVRKEKRKKRKECKAIGCAITIICCAVLTVSLALELSKEDTAPLAEDLSPSAVPSEALSSAPSGAMDWRLDYEYLPDSSLDIIWRDPSESPQSKAIFWLKNHPQLSEMEEWRKRQLFALATFYHAMDGPSWPKDVQENWLVPDKHECYWFSSRYGSIKDGVYEMEPYYDLVNVGHACDDEMRFQSLIIHELQSYEKKPSIPPEISLLTSLKALALPFNNVNGSLAGFLPTEFYQLRNLSFLYLEYNHLTGPFPSELGLLTSMTELHLNRNAFTGTIPSEFALMTNIRSLFLDSNNHNGAIPSQLGLMTSTTQLALWGINLDGPTPSELGMMTKLAYLDLSDNSLSRAIPTELGTMTSMTWLKLHSNTFSGSIPSELGAMTLLKHLGIGNNTLSGEIPSHLDSLAINGSLRALNLETNSLVGTVSESLCSLGKYHHGFQLGLSFDCSDQLCGCCWCPCPDSSTSIPPDECETSPLEFTTDDEDWPGAFPTPVNRSNAITINIRTDSYSQDLTIEWSLLSGLGAWKVLDSISPPDERGVFNYTKDVDSNSVYRLRLSDDNDYGIGMGWFSITNSTPSRDYPNGTLVWGALVDDFESSMDQYVWINEDGQAQYVQNFW